MEKFPPVACTPGLMATKLELTDEQPPGDEAAMTLFAFLNTSSNIVASMMSNFSSLDFKSKEKVERKERLQTFLAHKSSWLDLAIAPKPWSPNTSNDGADLPAKGESEGCLSKDVTPVHPRSASNPVLSNASASALDEDSMSRRKKIARGSIFRNQRKVSHVRRAESVVNAERAQDLDLEVEPHYILDEDSTGDDQALLLPGFGFRLELGTPMTPEQRAEACRVENLSLQSQDDYRHYFKDFFVDQNQVYINILGYDQTLGPIAITSELREKDEDDRNMVLIRTKKGIARTSLPATPSSQDIVKLLKVQEPALANAKFSRIKDPALTVDLLELEHKMITKNYKFGILYVREGQTQENDMFANVETSPAFEEFLEFLGDRVTLQGWKGFRGGLDVNKDSTGTHSVHTKHMNFEVMFHVSTLLPFNPGDEQQLERKRHLGNDIVVIIFVDGPTPYPPDLIKSEFNHTFAVVQPYKSPEYEGKTFYKIGFADKIGVRSYGPLLPDPPVFEKSESFRQWFMTKLVNAERASLHAPGFKSKIQRTRMLLLKGMIDKYCKKDLMPHADSFSVG